MTLNFYIRFSTSFGQSLFVSGNNNALGNDELTAAIPLQYFNGQFWRGRVEVPAEDLASFEIEYRYVLLEKDGSRIVEWGNDRVIPLKKNSTIEIVLVDTWNNAGLVENAFFTKPFEDILLKPKTVGSKTKPAKYFSHEFKVKAPLLKNNEVLCIGGSGLQLDEWQTLNPCLMLKEGNWWVGRLNLAAEIFPIAYKYGVYDTTQKKFTRFETGDNRVLNSESGKASFTIIHDGFARLGFPAWKGAGVAIPVFSLRTANGFGTGEFADIKLLADWAKVTGIKLIQLLPVNDTTATHTFLDSYPYAAISAFALHPLYLNLEKVAGAANSAIIKPLKKKQTELNNLPDVDYVQVMATKFAVAKALYAKQKKEFLKNTSYFEFFEMNRHWLVPYAVFCYLRDKYKTADYNQWQTHNVFDEDEVQALAAPSQKHYDDIALHYFIQYHLHLQLKEATAYAHSNGIIVKGDLPIGIYRYGCDAWMAPQLYNMDAQAGAPPDDFAVKGQNWGFPTYNWKVMQQDGFAWWRNRFGQMSGYFDAFRIDHILGFFRIWSIPLHAVQGIMGRFVPAIAIHVHELNRQNISFQFKRYCQPYMPDHIINERFAQQADYVKETFLTLVDGSFQFKEVFNTQRKTEQYFNTLPATVPNDFIKEGLFDMFSNVILFEEEGSGMQQFHFRFNMHQTSSFQELDDHSKVRLKELYINYFFQRQDDFWRKEGMNKLPGLKSSTNMLVCGEDLGMVPTCVPDVMRQLGILSLEIQRMPKSADTEFFHPADAPYLSVVTPSTHDMSTIRGWWQEDPAKTQRFYNTVLNHSGAAPFYCEANLNQQIVAQHLFSPAMWCIFQFQDILGSDETLRRQNPDEERINIPADPKHYWRYRMHLTLEDLITKKEFNNKLQITVAASGR